jgi:outer membrane protein OmpA-like peptidoglycan-associated protein
MAAKIKIIFTIFMLALAFLSQNACFGQKALLLIYIEPSLTDSVVLSISSKGEIAQKEKYIEFEYPIVKEVEPNKAYELKILAYQGKEIEEGLQYIEAHNLQENDVCKLHFSFFMGCPEFFDNLNFEKKSYKLDYLQNIATLDSIVQSLYNLPNFLVKISGYADPQEPHAKKISLQRAEIAKKYLIEQGIGGCRITTEGFGYENPAVPNKVDGKWDKNNMLLNRRVSIRFREKYRTNYYVINFPPQTVMPEIMLACFRNLPNGKKEYINKSSFVTHKNKMIVELATNFLYDFIWIQADKEHHWQFDNSKSTEARTLIDDLPQDTNR